ncbi:hypothetical protein Cch01nite_24810 [Cellulomonas chitinilytica]|uniref:Tyr recombinase domain-containing protein n=1 Tax=Cellulomonas chitinilytica TaxID=398759 RepID=A0A919U2S3_9CELL|nr:hypothetical protein [Cellulomonas chitinilytica]GIG21757.1 hypothetical protein Cch01nite_24810 [Cellulomonas chitinilytica]
MNAEPEGAFDWAPWLEGYKPKQVQDWAGIESFVRDAASAYFAAKPSKTKSAALAVVRPIVDIAAFQHGRAKLTIRTVFTTVTLQQFDKERGRAARQAADAGPKAARTGTLGKREASSGTKHSHLVRIGRVVNPGGGWGPEPATHRRFVTQPYAPHEIAWLEDSVTRNEGLARVNGEALLVLGLGAGLAGRDALVRARDCQLSALGIEITVDGRHVPVLARYEGRLLNLLEHAEPDDILLGSQARNKNAVNAAAARVKIAEGGPALEPGRMRNTWILEHLAAGVDVKVLMRAAGLKTLTPISDLAAFLPDLPHNDAFAMLRRGGESR